MKKVYYGCLLAAAFVFVILLMRELGFGQVTAEALSLRPYPDATDQVWQAAAFAKGRSPLMPIGHELHPSRYSPIHPLILAGWIKITGGQWQNVIWWPQISLLLGLVILCFGLARLGLSWPAVVVSGGLVGTSVLFIEISQSLLQESTIFLLIVIDIWLIGVKKEQLRLGVNFISGLIAAALVCIRPTYVVWPIIRFGYILWVQPKHRLNLRQVLLPWPYLLGATLVLAGVVLYIHSISGRWGTQAYAHWQNTQGLFAWKNLNSKLPWGSHPHQTVWEQVVYGVLGFNQDVTALGPIVMGIVYSGLGLGLPFLLRQRSFMVAILVFGGMQALVHAFYFLFASRFMVAVYPWLVVAGVAGWDAFIRQFLLGRSDQEKRLAVVFAIALVMMMLNPIHVRQMSKAYARVQARDSTDYAEFDRVSFEDCGKIIRYRDGALFVDGVDTVTARLMLGLEDWAKPIYQLSWRKSWWGEWREGHYCELKYAKPRGLSTRVGRRPYDIWLLRQGELDLHQLEDLMSHQQEVVVMYHRSQDSEYAQAVDQLRANFGVEHTPAGSDWRILILQKNVVVAH